MGPSARSAAGRQPWIVATVLAIGSPVIGAGHYRVTELPDLGGGSNLPMAVNNAGVVVGQSLTAANLDHAYVWQLGQIVDLGAAQPDRLSWAMAISDTGVIAGWMDADGGTRAVLFRDGTVFDLGMTSATAGGVIDDGMVAGWMLAPDLQAHAFRWQGDEVTDLGTLGGPSSYAGSLNAAGQIAGTADNAAGDPRAVVWDGDRIIDLGTLGGSWSSASSIADDGTVVGTASTAADAVHAFMWRADRGIVDLGTLDGCGASYASAINRQGQIVGTVSNCDRYGAVLWEQGEIFDLQELVPRGSVRLFNAMGINDAGQIIGNAYPNAVLLTPADLGDLDGDGAVGVRDLLELLAGWGACAREESCAADLNHDGGVDAADFTLLLGNWS